MSLLQDGLLVGLISSVKPPEQHQPILRAVSLLKSTADF
jgi:hypothetical protein